MNQGFVVYETQFGNIRMEYEEDKIILMKKVHTQVTDKGVATKLTDKVYQQLLEYFDGKRKVFDFPYKMNGTEFQKKVWKALCHIPYGETRTYKDIAVAVGNSKASRAVGMANNRNPITIAVPCHRVIGSNGKLVGYAGGVDMKEKLLEMEKKINEKRKID